MYVPGRTGLTPVGRHKTSTGRRSASVGRSSRRGASPKRAITPMRERSTTMVPTHDHQLFKYERQSMRKKPEPHNDPGVSQGGDFVDRFVEVLADKSAGSWGEHQIFHSMYTNFMRELWSTGQDPRVLESITHQLHHVLSVAFNVVEEKESIFARDLQANRRHAGVIMIINLDNWMCKMAMYRALDKWQASCMIVVVKKHIFRWRGRAASLCLNAWRLWTLRRRITTNRLVPALTLHWYQRFLRLSFMRWRSETFVWFVQELDGSVSKVQRLTEWRHRSTHAWQRGVLQRHLEKWRSYQRDMRRQRYIWDVEDTLLRVVVRAWRKRTSILLKKRARAEMMGRRASLKGVVNVWGRLTDERIICREIINRMVSMFRSTSIGKGFALWQQVVEDYFRSKDLVLQFVLRMNNAKMTQGFLQWKHQHIVANQRIQADLAHLKYFQKMQARKSSSRRTAMAFHKWKKMTQTCDWQQDFIYKYVHKGTMRRRLLQWRRNATMILQDAYNKMLAENAKLREAMLAENTKMLAENAKLREAMMAENTKMQAENTKLQEAMLADNTKLKYMLILRTTRRMVRKAFGESMNIWRYMTRMKRRVHIMFSRVVNLQLSLAVEKWREICGDVKKRVAQLVATYGQRLKGSALFLWRKKIYMADAIKNRIFRILFRKMRGGFLRWKDRKAKYLETRWQYNWLRGRLARIVKGFKGDCFRQWRRTAEKMIFIEEHALEPRIVLGELLNLRQHAQANNLIKALLHNIQHVCKDRFEHWKLHCVSMVQRARTCVYRWVGKLEKQRLQARWLHWLTFTYAGRKATMAATVARVLPSFRKALTHDAWTRFSATQKLHRMLRLLASRADLTLVGQSFYSWNTVAADHTFVDGCMERAFILLERWALRRAFEKIRRDTNLYKALRGPLCHTYRRIVSSAVVSWQRAVLADSLRDHESAQKYIGSSMLAAAKEKRFATWRALASKAHRKRRVMNRVLIYVKGGAVGMGFRSWKKLSRERRSWMFLVATWARGTPFLNFHRWRKYTHFVRCLQMLVKLSLRKGEWFKAGLAIEKWKEVTRRHAAVRALLVKTLRLKTAQAFAQMHREVQRRYWKLKTFHRNFENIARYWLHHKSRAYFTFWQHKTRLVRMAATRLISSCSVGRRIKALSAFRKLSHTTLMFRGAKTLVARTVRHMMRTSLIMGMSQWKRSVALLNSRRVQVLGFLMTKMRNHKVQGLSRWMRNTSHMTRHMVDTLYRTNEDEARKSFARYRTKIVGTIVQRRQRDTAKSVIDTWHSHASITLHLKNWLSRAVNYKTTVLLKAALRTWRNLSMAEAYNELGMQASRDRRELAHLRAEVGEVRGQKQQVSDQLNYSMHVLEYVMANQ